MDRLRRNKPRKKRSNGFRDRCRGSDGPAARSSSRNARPLHPAKPSASRATGRGLPPDGAASTAASTTASFFLPPYPPPLAEGAFPQNGRTHRDTQPYGEMSI